MQAQEKPHAQGHEKKKGALPFLRLHYLLRKFAKEPVEPNDVGGPSGIFYFPKVIWLLNDLVVRDFDFFMKLQVSLIENGLGFFGFDS